MVTQVDDWLKKHYMLHGHNLNAIVPEN